MIQRAKRKRPPKVEKQPVYTIHLTNDNCHLINHKKIIKKSEYHTSTDENDTTPHKKKNKWEMKVVMKQVLKNRKRVILLNTRTNKESKGFLDRRFSS